MRYSRLLPQRSISKEAEEQDVLSVVIKWPEDQVFSYGRYANATADLFV